MTRTPSACTAAALLIAPLALALSACGNAREPASVNEDRPQIVEPDFGGGCDAEAGQQFVGQMLDDALSDKAKAATGARNVRVIRPGMAVTMDYRPDRLNIDLDEDGRVTRVHCG